MEYTTFGKTGRKVSRIGFGGAVAGLKNYLHEYDPSSDESIKSVVEAIEKALDLGINYFDTAPGYGNGQSEKMFGIALEGIEPENIFLATKVSFGSYDDVMRSVESSLKNLHRDRIDLLQIHGDSITYDMAEAILSDNGMLKAMEKNKKSRCGKIYWFYQ